MASMFVKMVTILSLYLMLVVLVESTSTLIGGLQETDLEVTCNKVIGAQSGDDCTTISKSFKLGLESFLAINPNINCTSIFVGQWLCVNGTLTT
ncbi:putative LysM domain-containing protein [Helianthus annuus]|nr:putative LysM domain-containing protein [Helianthus annuus]KAJ0460971.1 putative LysM domain-containing protein [Helianthus annuus]KAJ0641399.1 putative LysM domain-containing protein [Helianthus annuus]KAJ0645297.1 putative LysM domain-containing protein [Helianthus annuus]